MKRTLLGFAALVLVVGLGSLGVFVAHRAFMASVAPPADPQQTPVTAAGDRMPTPIRLAGTAEEQPTTIADPFPAQAVPAPVAEAQAGAAVPGDDIPNADRLSLADDRTGPETPQADPAAAPDTAMPANRSAEPLATRQRSAVPDARYAERRTTAELTQSDLGDDVRTARQEGVAVDEPRRLSASASRRQIERYGRPSLAEQDPGNRQQPAADQQPLDEPSTADPQAGADSEPGIADAPGNDASALADGTGRPGDPQLSGSQAPTLVIEKTAPPEIQIGKPAKFVIKVRNTGSAVAQGVEIHDTIPQGTQLIDTTPQAKRGPQGSLVWDLGALKPNEEQKVELQLMPTAEGEIGSVATVHFRAEASVRTLATKPMLKMDVAGPAKVMKGDAAIFKIKIANPGTGAATGVVVTETVPQGLTHRSGNALEFEVGTLRPGESRELELSLTAAVAGPVMNVISAQGDANLQAEAETPLEVVAPQLQVSMTGPKRRYLERNALHNISVSNPGTASARDVELVAVLPKELKFVEANNGGQFDAASHSVYWSLEELPPQETGSVTLTTLPVESGDAKLLIKGKALDGLADEREEVVTIEGLAAINFQISDANDPIEAGGQTTYQVRVTNPGSKAASNVRLVAILPREMKAVSAEGPVRFKVEGQRVVFEPLKQLAPKADASFAIKVQALEPGDLRVQVQVSTDEVREPVTKEENTRVYGDE